MVWSKCSFGLDFLVQVDQPLGERLANQTDESLAIVFRDGMDLWFVIWFVVCFVVRLPRMTIGGIAVVMVLLNGTVRATRL